MAAGPAVEVADDVDLSDDESEESDDEMTMGVRNGACDLDGPPLGR